MEHFSGTARIIPLGRPGKRRSEIDVRGDRTVWKLPAERTWEAAGREAIMYCNACGQAIGDQGGFCAHCGHVVGQSCPPSRLMRPRSDRRIAGVCAGFAHYMNVDVILVRILWVFLTFAAGIVPGVIAYVVAWVIMPEQAALPAASVMERQQPVAG
jgi:phage shock protein C